MIRSLVAVALLGAVFASSASAQQQQEGPSHVLRAGKLYSFGGGDQLDHGFGLDLRYQVYPERQLEAFIGIYGQGQYELEEAWRFTGGITGGWGIFGLELGISHRTATADYAGSTGLQIGQSLTFGPVSIGARLTLPLVDHVAANVDSGPMAVQGIEGALTVTVGWGFTLSGPQRSTMGCHGHHGGHQ